MTAYNGTEVNIGDWIAWSDNKDTYIGKVIGTTADNFLVVSNFISSAYSPLGAVTKYSKSIRVATCRVINLSLCNLQP
jgi:hypothetical protein